MVTLADLMCFVSGQDDDFLDLTMLRYNLSVIRGSNLIEIG